jgi:hypothetical protein
MTITDIILADLRERVSKFNRMELPGQPMGMHMGTSYLVNDLMQALEAAISAHETKEG